MWTIAATLAAGAAGLPGCAHGDSVHETVIRIDDPQRVADARALALQAQAARNSDKAFELYQRSLARSRSLGFVQNNLGLLLLERGNYTDAVAMFQEASEVMPESPKPLYNIGLTYFRCGWDEKAMGFYEKALACTPEDRETLRGAVLAVKRLDWAREADLARARLALMKDQDPQWRRLEQSEVFRIEAALAAAKNGTPLQIQTGLTAPDKHASPDAAPPPAPAPAPVNPPQPQAQPMQSPDQR